MSVINFVKINLEVENENHFFEVYLWIQNCILTMTVDDFVQKKVGHLVNVRC